MYKKPEPLNKGDKVGIFVPSSPVKEPYRTNGLKQLKSLGYVPVEAENILSKAADADFLAKSPQQSFEDIQRFLKDDQIKALWVGRGGYGSNLLLPVLKKLEVPKPKIVIGASDASYLLWYLLDHYKLIVFYGPMVYSSLAEDRFDAESLRNALTGNYHGTRLTGEPLIQGKARGIVTGGCLSNFVSLIGTSYLPEIEQRILLLEDTSERPYRLDRMFWQLYQAGVFAKINGLLLGQFPGCFKDDKEKKDFLNRVRFYLKEYDIPVIYGLPLGHGSNIHTLPLGIEIEVDTSIFPGVLL
jgi:muramoyltetrapeptide carboxypeptidase